MTGVELGNKFPRDAATAAPDPAERTGSTLVSGWYSGRLLERDVDAEWNAMRAHFELLHALGLQGDGVRGSEPLYARRPARTHFAASASAARANGSASASA